LTQTIIADLQVIEKNVMDFAEAKSHYDFWCGRCQVHILRGQVFWFHIVGILNLNSGPYCPKCKEESLGALSKRLGKN
jgi:hypothetical protein